MLNLEIPMKSKNYNLTGSFEVLVTSESGDKIALKNNIKFQHNNEFTSENSVEIFPDRVKQTLYGIGTSFTESSAFVLAHLEQDKRHEVMRNIYSEEGANFTLTRTHIGSCDFCVEGKYSYNDVAGDMALENFSILPDDDGFDKSKYPGIQDESFDLLPMILEAQSIKSEQEDQSLKIISSPWTAPPWMKTNEDWYTPSSETKSRQGMGGALKPECEAVFADYFIRYLKAYKSRGVSIWGITPVNEPFGNNGQWESMDFTPETQKNFIKYHLGPKLEANYPDVKLFTFDHNRDGLEEWVDEIYNDPEAAKHVAGAAIHWYESTFKVYEDELDKVHEKYPLYSIIHTEGCIDDLGKDAPDGVLDPKGFKEENWFDNDDFWWNDNATDWAYTTTWEGVKADDHPMYAPVHRYARNIIVSLNHWLNGWIDWNIVLDKNGGPNHVGNFCGAPIMIDTDTQYVYYTPVFYILAQFSKTIRPGDKVVDVSQKTSDSLTDKFYSTATLSEDNVLTMHSLNTEKTSVEYELKIGVQVAVINIPPNCLQSIRIQL